MKLFRQIGGQGGEAGRRMDQEKAGALAERQEVGKIGGEIKNGRKLNGDGKTGRRNEEGSGWWR